MSIATQVKRLQDVRNQIRAKMVSLGISKDTDLLKDLADDLDNIAAATSGDVSGSVEGSNPKKITLTTANTSDSSETTATAQATITKGLYTGSSNIVADLTSKKLTATAEATLATSVTGTTPVPTTLPSGTVTITPNTDNTRRIYSDSANNGFITNVVLEAMASSSVTANNPTEDPGTGYTNKSTVTPTESTQYVKITAGYLPNSKVTVNAIPSPYFDTGGVTATADTVLKNYTFVNPKGTTVTGAIATATSDNVSGSVEGSDPDEIVLSTETLAKTITVPATAKATVAKNLYTGSSDIVADLKSNTFFVTARATLVSTASITSTDQVPSPLPAGTAQISPSTDNVARLYTASNDGFMTGVYLSPMPSGSVYGPYYTKPDESYTNKLTITPVKTTQYVKITAGHLPNSKITVEGIPKQEFTIAQSAWSATSSATENGSYTCTVSGLTDVTASNDVVVLPGNTSVVDSCGVYASSQGAESITFKAFNKPSSDIQYTVYILK